MQNKVHEKSYRNKILTKEYKAGNKKLKGQRRRRTRIWIYRVKHGWFSFKIGEVLRATGGDYQLNLQLV